MSNFRRVNIIFIGLTLGLSHFRHKTTASNYTAVCSAVQNLV
jgi:hypothetical protein